MADRGRLIDAGVRSGWLAGAKRIANGALNVVDPLVVRRWRRGDDRGGVQIPPRKLRARVGTPSVDAWLPGGASVASEIETVLRSDGLDLNRFQSVLDFGCGSGRVLSRLSLDPQAAVCGLDVDSEAIAWLEEAEPTFDVRVNPAAGPAPFDSDAFDLIVSISIFTHLNRESQRIWLAEVARMLRPGGYALLTTLGDELQEAWASGNRPGVTRRQVEMLRRSPTASDAGFVFAPEVKTRWNSWRYHGVESDYGLAFWGHDAIRSEWAEWFEIVRIEPASVNWRQDAVLLRSA